MRAHRPSWLKASALRPARKVDRLLRSLQSSSIDARRKSIKEFADLVATGAAEARSAFEPLVGALADEDSDVRGSAASALGHLGDLRALDPLIAALHDDFPYVRGLAAMGLGMLGDVRAISPLLDILTDDTDPFPRIWASEALGTIGDTRAVPALRTALERNPENDRLKSAIAHSLDQLGASARQPTGPVERTQSFQDLITGFDAAHDDPVRQAELIQRAARIVQSEPESPQKHLMELEVATRYEGLKERTGYPGLSKGTQEGVDVDRLILELQEEPSIGDRAERSLVELGAARVVEPLIAALGHEERWRAAAVLGKLGDPRAVEPLIAVISKPDEEFDMARGSAAGIREPSARLVRDRHQLEPPRSDASDADGLEARPLFGR